jgi:predicted PurR-regulated permease PerM
MSTEPGEHSDRRSLSHAPHSASPHLTGRAHMVGAGPVTGARRSGSAEPVQLIAFEPRALRRSVVAILLLVTAWITALWVFSAVSRFLFLLLLSWLFAMAMEPAIGGLARRGWRRGAATALVGGGVLAIVALLGGLFGNLFFTQLSQLVAAAPGVVTDVISRANSTFHLKLDATSIAASLKLNPSQVGTMASDLAGGVLGLVSSLLSALLDVFTFVVFAFYLAADGPRVRRTIGSWLSPAHQDVFVTVWDIAVAKTGGYVVSKVELAALSAVFHGVFFNFVNVPYWLPLALLVGMLAQFIPVLGTYLGIIVPILFVVFTPQHWTALWILLFATVYQQIETYVFTPRVSRRTMDVNSGIALGSVFVGSALWGVIGALIGIPLAAAAVALLDTYGHRHELVPALATELEPEDEYGGPGCDEDEIDDEVGEGDGDRATAVLGGSDRTAAPDSGLP